MSARPQTASQAHGLLVVRRRAMSVGIAERELRDAIASALLAGCSIAATARAALMPESTLRLKYRRQATHDR